MTGASCRSVVCFVRLVGNKGIALLQALLEALSSIELSAPLTETQEGTNTSII